MIEIGGQSNHQGVTFRSDNYEIEVKTFPNIEIGDVKPSEKSKKENRELKIIFPLLIVLLIFDEIFIRKTPWLVFRTILVVAMTATIIYYSYRFGIGFFQHTRINHGAEHKTIMAYRNGKIDNIDKASRFTIWCGGSIVGPILIIAVLGDLVHYPYTLSLIYYLCYLYIGPIRNILFNIIGIPVQLITTKEPSPEILEATKIGLLKLVREEENHIDKETKRKEGR